MPQPFDSEDAPYAPTPVLMGQRHDVQQKEPSIVRDCRILCISAMVLYGLFTVVIFLLTSTGIIDMETSGFDPSGIVICFFTALFGLVLWLFLCLRARNKYGWQAQIAISAIGLLCFPIGTFIHVLVLIKWDDPDVRAWFGIPMA